MPPYWSLSGAPPPPRLEHHYRCPRLAAKSRDWKRKLDPLILQGILQVIKDKDHSSVRWCDSLGRERERALQEAEAVPLLQDLQGPHYWIDPIRRGHRRPPVPGKSPGGSQVGDSNQQRQVKFPTAAFKAL